MELLKIEGNVKSSLLYVMNSSMFDKYIVITDWDSHFYICHPRQDMFHKFKGRLYISRSFLPSTIDFEDGWEILYTNSLEEALDALDENFEKF